MALKTNRFTPKEDMYVTEAFDSYIIGDIISAGTLTNDYAIKMHIKGKLKNVGSRSNYNEKELMSMSMTTLRELGEPYGVTDRSKSKLVKELLAVL